MIYLLESVSLDSNLKVGYWCMGAHTVPGHIMFRYMLKHSYISLTLDNRTIRVYTPMHGNTQLLRAIHSYTGICRAIQRYRGLYKALQGYTQLHRVTQSYTGLYTAVHGYTQLDMDLQSYTKLYRATQSYKGLYKAMQSYTKLYRAIRVYTRLNGALQSINSSSALYTVLYVYARSRWLNIGRDEVEVHKNVKRERFDWLHFKFKFQIQIFKFKTNFCV